MGITTIPSATKYTKMYTHTKVYPHNQSHTWGNHSSISSSKLSGLCQMHTGSSRCLARELRLVHSFTCVKSSFKTSKCGEPPNACINIKYTIYKCHRALTGRTGENWVSLLAPWVHKCYSIAGNFHTVQNFADKLAAAKIRTTKNLL